MVLEPECVLRSYESDFFASVDELQPRLCIRVLLPWGYVLNAGTVTRRGEVVFYVPSGEEATRSGVTIANDVIISKEGEGTLNENALGYNKTQASSYAQREGTVRFAPSTSNYLDMGPTYCISGGTLSTANSHLQIARDRTGRFVQTGGTVNMLNDNNGKCNVLIGVHATGEYDMTGGELKGVQYCQIGFGNNAVGTMKVSCGKVPTDDFRIGANGTGYGEVLQTGGDVNTGTLYIPMVSTATGEYDISDGTLTINNANVGYKGNGTFIQRSGSHMRQRVNPRRIQAYFVLRQKANRIQEAWCYIPRPLTLIVAVYRKR